MAIDKDTGQLEVGEGYSLDYEAPVDFNEDNVYIVEIVADDGYGSMVAMEVVLTVTDVDEPPSLAISDINPRVGAELTSTLHNAPDNPENLTWQWQRADDGADPTWVDIADATSATYTVITADLGQVLRAVASYQDEDRVDQEVQSAATAVVRAANRDPAFPSETAVRMVPENTLAEVEFGSPVSATDADDDTLTYFIAGAEASAFACDPASGQLSTSADLDYETKTSYQVTVSVADGEGGAASVAVTIEVTNVNEPPDRPDKPAVANGHEQVTVTWSAPTNPGPAISGYDVQYRVRDAVTFNDTANFGATATSGAITGLDRGIYYQVEVRAKNADGDGSWSETSDAARVNPNEAPEFDSGLPPAVNVAESPTSGDPIGGPYTASDADGDTVSYTLDGVDAGVFAVGETTGQIAVGDGYTLDFENPVDSDTDNTYVVEIVADDGHEGQDSFGVSITITNVDEPGSVTLSTTNPRVGSGLTATLSDPDGEPDTESWQWQWAADGADPTWVDIADATSATYTVVAADLGKVLRAVVGYQNEDGVDQEVWSAATAAVRAANRLPAFPSGTAVRMVPENTLAKVEFGSPVLATDADDDPLAYALSGADASDFALDPASGQLSTSADLDYETKNSYQVTVSVTDGEGGSASVAVTIQVTNVNEPPDRPAIPRVAGGREQVTVTWSAPSNPGPAISDYDVKYWIMGNVAYTVASYDATVTQDTITGLARGKFYEVQVRAKSADGAGPWSQTSETSKASRVFPNEPPEFDSGRSAAFNVAESPTSGDALGDPYTAYDDDDDSVTYTLEGEDANVLAVDKDTGQLEVGEGYSLDYEAQVDFNEDNVYMVEIVADDGYEGIASFDVSITITNVDEPGSVTLSATNPRVGSELTATLSDPDGEPDTESWQWQRADDGADPTWVDIADATAATYTVATVDLGKFLRAVVGYQNEDGIAQEVRSAATAAVRAANRLPAFPEVAAVRTVAENTVAGVEVGPPVSATDADDDPLTYALSGAHASDFALDPASGQLSTSADLDYEAKTSYQVTVSVADGEGGAASVAVTIEVTNVKEPPDRPAIPALVGGHEEVTVTWSAPTNPGPAISGYEVQYRLGDADTFDDVASFGATATSGAITELERGRDYEVQVRAKNADGDGPWSETSDTARVNPNNIPQFDAPAEFNLPEGPSAGDTLGDPYTAYDADEEDHVAYTLEGEDAGVLAVDKATGQLVVGEGYSLDYEVPVDLNEDNVYMVEIVAEDSYGDMAAMEIAITVTNVDEPGAVALSVTDPRVGSELTATLSDPDDEPVAVGWQWQRADDPANPAWIDIIGANGATYVVVDADMGMVLRAIIRYQSQNGAEKEVPSTVTFVVDSSNGLPLFPSGTVVRVVAENTRRGVAIGFPVEAIDPEGDPLTYSLSGVDASSFGFDATSGQLSTNGADLDFETKNSYQVTVSATDDHGGTANVAVTIRVTNVNEPPGLPVLESATGGRDQVTVKWSTPPNMGPAILGYDVQYKFSGANTFDGVARFGPTSTSGVVTGLARGRYYQFRVRAKNAEGDGPWSETSEVARVDDNESPKFNLTVNEKAFSVPEGPGSGDAIGSPYIADEDDGDPVTYSLNGVDAGVLVIGPATGQIMVGDGFILDYENPADDNHDNIYVIEVVAEDGHDGSDQMDVTITVMDVFESGIGLETEPDYEEILPPTTPTPSPSPTPTATPTLDTHTNADAFTDSHSYADTYANTYSDAFTDSHSYANTYPH